MRTDKPDTMNALIPMDSRTLQTLVDHHTRFRSFLEKRLGDRTLADDLIQDALIRAIERPVTLRDDGNITSWFYRVLRNTMIDHFRADQFLAKKHSAFLNELVALGDDKFDPQRDLEGQICACVTELLPTLKPEYRQLLEKIDLGGEKPASVADELDISLNNLNVRLSRARNALKISLRRSCGTCCEHGGMDCHCKKQTHSCCEPKN